MDNGYTRWGCQDTWGAQTHPMGYRGDIARQKVRELIAGVGNVVFPIAEWVAPPPARLQQYARVLG